MKKQLRSVLGFFALPIGLLGFVFELLAIGFQMGQTYARQVIAHVVVDKDEIEAAKKREIDKLVAMYQRQFPEAKISVRRVSDSTVAVSVDGLNGGTAKVERTGDISPPSGAAEDFSKKVH